MVKNTGNGMKIAFGVFAVLLVIAVGVNFNLRGQKIELQNELNKVKADFESKEKGYTNLADTLRRTNSSLEADKRDLNEKLARAENARKIAFEQLKKEQTRRRR